MTINVDWPPVMQFLRVLKENLKENICVAEIGCWKGDTSVKYLPVIKSLNGKVYLIDWFQGCEGFVGGLHGFDPSVKDEIHSALLNNVKELECENMCSVLKGTSWEKIKELPDDSIDIAFIDAGHRYEDVIKDLKAIIPKMKKNGILVGHDYADTPQHRGVIQAFNELFSGRIEIRNETYPEHLSQNMPCCKVQLGD